MSCSLWSKVTKLKANHNISDILVWVNRAVPYGAKLLNWKQITTTSYEYSSPFRCSLWSKVTKLKANHNTCDALIFSLIAVPYGAKLLNWKQITTNARVFGNACGCSLWSKVTKLKANHNSSETNSLRSQAVPYGAKLLNWKQITTRGYA